MGKIHSPIVRISKSYKIYFERFNDKVFPYKHIALIIELGASTIFRTIGTDKKQCRDLMLAMIPELVKSIEFLQTAEFENNSY